MSGNFQPAKLDVDSSLLDSRLSFVSSKEEEELDNMFSMINQDKKIETLLPEAEYSSCTVYPKPGLCVKTKNSKGQKFFVNLCRVEEIPAPTPMKEDELERMIMEEDYSNLWKVPMSIGAPRKEKDKSGSECLAADVAVNSDWFSRVMENSQIFTGFVITVAMEGLGDKYGEEARLERDGWSVLKNKKYLGDKVPPHNIQKRASIGIRQINPQDNKVLNSSDESNETKVKKTLTPQFKIEKNKVEDPTEVTTCIHLPGIHNLNQINLRLGEDRLVLDTRTYGYHLDIFLPVNLQYTSSKAWFNKDTHVLHIRSPIL